MTEICHNPATHLLDSRRMDATWVLSSGVVAKPRPLDDVAADMGMSRRTMWRLVKALGIQKHRYPGDRRAHIDPDEVRRKMAKPAPWDRKPKPPADSSRPS